MDAMSYPQARTEVLVDKFVVSVYHWMCIGLALTGFIAFYVSHSETMMSMVFGNRVLFFGLIIAELALVFTISRITQDRIPENS